MYCCLAPYSGNEQLRPDSLISETLTPVRFQYNKMLPRRWWYGPASLELEAGQAQGGAR